MRRELPIERLEGHDAALARAAGVAESRFARVLRGEVTVERNLGLSKRASKSIDIYNARRRHVIFLDASWHLYMRVLLPVRRIVGPSVGRSVCLSIIRN